MALDNFNASDAEWSESTASYSIGARVKISNTGALSSLFFIEGNSGAHIDGVSGFNESTYPQIGYIIAGAGCGYRADNVFVHVNAKELVHFLPALKVRGGCQFTARPILSASIADLPSNNAKRPAVRRRRPSNGLPA